MIDQQIKAVGLLVAVILFGYALAIAYSSRYDRVSNKYASAFSTVALVVFLVALGGFFGPPTNRVVELAGYAIAIGGGSFAFARITQHKDRFRRA